MSAPHVALRLPDHERDLLAVLVSPWRDLLYAPGPGFTSPLDPGAYRTSIVIVPAAGPAVRVSSVVMPAFGAEICRLRLEALPHDPPPSLGSFFDPARTGTVYALTPDRERAAAQAPARAEWRYDGVSLAPRLGGISGPARAARARARPGRLRGKRTAGSPSSAPTASEPGAGGGRAGGGGAVPAVARSLPGRCSTPRRHRKPGVTVRDLLGHGDRDAGVEITIELLPLS